MNQCVCECMHVSVCIFVCVYVCVCCGVCESACFFMYNFVYIHYIIVLSHLLQLIMIIIFYLSIIQNQNYAI